MGSRWSGAGKCSRSGKGLGFVISRCARGEACEELGLSIVYKRWILSFFGFFFFLVGAHELRVGSLGYLFRRANFFSSFFGGFHED